jgi:Flp pilus assembly pilin Flp
MTMPGYGGRRRRGESGATTAEYVGIVAFVALLAVSVIGFITPVGGQAKSIVRTAYCHIGSTLGGAGCSNEELPYYIPTKCTISATGKQYGGSVSIIATVGGDTGYTIYRIRERQPDGTFKDTYVVKTTGKATGKFEFGPKGGAEVGTGDGGVEAKGGAVVGINGEIEGGQTFTFDNEQEARDFASDNVDNFGGLFGVDGGPEATSTYFQAGAGASVEGSAGPLKGNVGGKAVLGVETFANGNTKFKLALTVEAAGSLGIPIPAAMLKAQAEGKLSVMVQADVTFDKNGNLTAIGGQIVGKATGSGQVNLGPGQGQPKNPDGSTPDALTLPGLTLQGGGVATLAFSSQFTDSAQNAALSEGVADFIGGNGLTDEFQGAIKNQLTNHSQYTFTVGTATESREEYGLSVNIFGAEFGAEGHVINTDENTTDGWYFNPTTGEWEENLACNT